VTGVNDAPQANPGALGAVEDAGPVTGSFPGNDVDSDDDQGSLIYTLLTQPSEGAVINNGNGTFSFDPGSGFQDLGTGDTRQVTFTYLATDSHGAGSQTGTVTVTVTGVNEPPVAVNDSVSTLRNTTATWDVAANDTDVDGSVVATSVVIVAQPANGTLVVNANGTVTYTPDTDFDGVDSFTYRVLDNEGAQSNVATVSIQVLNPPASWQNPDDPLDVNDDNFRTVLDALWVVNDIRDNLQFTGGVPEHDLNDVNQLQVAPFRRPFVDPSGDGFVRINDILLIITFLRSQLGGSPEGEGERESLDSPYAAFAPITTSSPSSAAEEEHWSQPVIVSPALDETEPPAAIDTDADDSATADDDSSDLDDVIAAIAEDVAGQWSEV
jgi:VCBS repeat-containing protein